MLQLIYFFLGFGLSRNRDVDDLLSILESGQLSDINEDSDDEIIQAESENNVRVGSDILHPNQILPVDDVEEQDTIEEQEEPRPEPSRQNTKRIQDIVWRKHLEFEPPTFTWSPPPSSQIESPLAPIEYFSKYIPDSLMQEMVFNTNLYATAKEVRNFKPCNMMEMKIFMALHNYGKPKVSTYSFVLGYNFRYESLHRKHAQRQISPDEE